MPAASASACSARSAILAVCVGSVLTASDANLVAVRILASSVFETALPQGLVVFGEISLSGDVRPVNRTEIRLKEAAKLGFSRALTSGGSAGGAAVAVTGVSRLADAMGRIGDERWD